MPIIPANGAIEGAISIAVLVIAFIGWLVQMAGQAKPQQPPPVNRQRPAGPAGKRPAGNQGKGLQSEIDAFLREVGSTRKSPPNETEDAIEILDEEEVSDRHRRPPQRRESVFAPSAPTSTSRPVDGQRAAGVEREQQHRRERPISTVSERHLESTPLGSEMRKHVEQYMAESRELRREKEKVERTLAEAQAQIRSLRSDQSSGQNRPAVRVAGSAGVVALLKDSRTVKDAIVINEILGKPRGLRPSHR